MVLRFFTKVGKDEKKSLVRAEKRCGDCRKRERRLFLQGIAENGKEGYFCRECSEGFRVFALGGVGREGESVLNQKIGI